MQFLSPVKNQELAAIFEDLADLEEIEGNKWGAISYRRVSASILALSEDINLYRERNQLKQIDGVGDAIEKKIIQFLETGAIQKHQEMLKKYPVDFANLRKIQGLGSKTIAVLYRELGVKNIEDLKNAIKEHRISELKGFTVKTEEKLKKGLEIVEKVSGRKLLADVYDYIHGLADSLKKTGFFEVATIAGSTRRMKETVGDIDILAVSKTPEKAVQAFISMPETKGIIVKGETKVTVVLDIGLTCDLRLLDAESYGAALQYFTGSKEHNIVMRDLAIQKGLKLNEYGLFREDVKVAGRTEEEVYRTIGLDWIPPELRENAGEIDAAFNHRLPDLVKFEDVKGDFHTHTARTDGISTIEDLAEKASSLGLSYIVVTDHSKSLKVANGLDEQGYTDLFRDIDRYNESSEKIKLLKGTEMEILKDGTLDLKLGILEQMDFVMGAMHQWVGPDRKQNTDRMVNAINSGMLDVVAHPTGRLIGTREPHNIDFDMVFEACRENGVALEVNGSAERSDLPPDLIRRAREYGLKFTLGSDTHRPEHMKYLKFAVAIARRGWLSKDQILNTSGPDKIRNFRHK